MCRKMVAAVWWWKVCVSASASFVVSRRGTGRGCHRVCGIKGFRSWFECQFPSAVSTLTAGGAVFDHVLIDTNQILHTTCRRARNEDHALALILKELDSIVARVALPRISIVLASDGPPPAAKLITQRNRRLSVVAKMRRMRRLATRYRSSRLPPRRNTKDHPHASSLAALSITPGTRFMKRVEEAFLYWAWKRLSTRGSNNNNNNALSIFMCCSSVPGEGEVKILDWLLNIQSSVRPGHSVAIVGGDSDLVLEGLILSPSRITHNVFVVLPDGKNKCSHIISLWETTRSLARLLHIPHTHHHQDDGTSIMKARTDLVLIIIMNGNDYLPKLRGTTGFRTLFHAYLRLLQSHSESTNNNNSFSLVDPDTLQFKIPSCLAFFQELVRMAPNSFYHTFSSAAHNHNNNTASLSITPLSYLHDMVNAGIIPKPIRWLQFQTNLDKETVDDVQHSSNGFDALKKIGDDSILRHSLNNKTLHTSHNDVQGELVRIMLGDKNQGIYYEFDAWHYAGQQTLQKTRQHLANIALEEILGKDYWNDATNIGRKEDRNSLSSSYGDDPDDYFFIDNDDEVEMTGTHEEENQDNDEEDSDMDNDGNENFENVYDVVSGPGYSWEGRTSAPCNVTAYLAGLLWNLQTYQDGVCANYGYNYGQRMAPTAEEIVLYLRTVQDSNQTLGREELLADEKFITPLTAGLSCLAALPFEVQHLVPYPYRFLLQNNIADHIYSSCMDPVTNVFDMEMFERECTQKLSELGHGNDSSYSSLPLGERKKIPKGGDMYWTVLRRTDKPLSCLLAPPNPYSDRVKPLLPSSQIVASRILATLKPRRIFIERNITQEANNRTKHKWRSSISDRKKHRVAAYSSSEDAMKRKYSDMSSLLTNSLGERQGIESIPYKKVHQNANGRYSLQRGGQHQERLSQSNEVVEKAPTTETQEMTMIEALGPQINGLASKRSRHVTDEQVVLQQRQQMATLPLELSGDARKNIEGQTASQCLQQLKDSRLIERLEWNWTTTQVPPTEWENNGTTNILRQQKYETVKLTISSHSKTLNYKTSSKGEGVRMKNLEIQKRLKRQNGSDGGTIVVAVFEHVRNINLTSRNIVKQHLAAMALDHLFLEKVELSWMSMTVKEMKSYQKSLLLSVFPSQ